MDLERLKIFGPLIDFEIKNPRLRKLVEHVLKRIPDECEAEFPPMNIYEFHSKDCYGGMVGTSEGEIFIYINVEKLNNECPDDDAPIIGVIAHEFAHAFLDHGLESQEILIRGGVEHPRSYELQADVLATKWGFGREVKAVRKKFGHWKSDPGYDTRIIIPGKSKSVSKDELPPD